MTSIKCVSPESLEPRSKWIHIGAGNFGDVYRVKNTELQLDVAVKQLKENTSCLPEELLAEAEKLKHASENYYVIRLFGIIKSPPCIIMEWMENSCLGTLIESVQDIPWALKYRILHEVALGMNWLHSLSPPLLHLDLKPRNVLLNEVLHIRITDFGLSKYTSPTCPCDNETIGGTLVYMPPEAFEKAYKPSESTDVYRSITVCGGGLNMQEAIHLFLLQKFNFAILSAVVLRGGVPYPVELTEVVKMNVCRGQRPSLESLENLRNVKHLDNAIAFTKQCWDNDKQQRPSFRECCNQWEIFKSGYTEKEIRKAAKDVVDCMDSSGATKDVSQSESVPGTNEMSDMIRQMQTIHIAEQPSANLVEAVPERSSVQHVPPAYQPRTHVGNPRPSTPNIRTGAQPLRSSQGLQSQQRGPTARLVHQPGQMGHNPRTNSFVYQRGNIGGSRTIQNSWAFPWPGVQTNMYNFPSPLLPGRFPVPPQSQYQKVSNISVTNTDGPCQFGDNNRMYYGATRRPQNTFNNPVAPHPPRTIPANYPSPAQTSNICISGSSGPIQIGDNNTMNVGPANPYYRPVTPQPYPTSSTSSRGPGITVQHPQTPTSHVPREDFSDAAQPTQETARQTDKPLESPSTSDTTEKNSLQGNDSVNSSSS